MHPAFEVFHNMDLAGHVIVSQFCDTYIQTPPKEGDDGASLNTEVALERPLSLSYQVMLTIC